MHLDGTDAMLKKNVLMPLFYVISITPVNKTK